MIRQSDKQPQAAEAVSRLRHRSRFGRHSRFGRLTSTLMAGALFGLSAATVVTTVVLGVAASSPLAHAQNFGQRTIEGVVYSDDGKTDIGATVFLKNIKSHNVRSFTTQSGGIFHFAQVGMMDDYEVWAEHAKAKSPVKTISSFDSRKELHMELKMK